MNPILSFELLFFAVFGHTVTDQTIVDKIDELPERTQPEWCDYFFKLIFGVYMLVSVIVLINLLIAMMSDTYQRIQAQSDTEWKFGLSKLIRNMFRTTTEAPPMNLVTTWLKYFIMECNTSGGLKKHKKARKIEITRYFGKASAKTRAAAKWIKNTETTAKQLQESMNESSISIKGKLNRFSEPKVIKLSIEKVVDWVMISNKFREISGDEEYLDTMSSQEGKEGEEGEEKTGGAGAGGAPAGGAAVHPV